VGGIDFSGLVDVYGDVNFNHPDSGVNDLYNFNSKADSFALNMVKLSMSHTADPIGFQVDLGFGRAFDTINGSDPSGSGQRYIEQAFVTWKPKKDSGFQFDFGKFVTAAGAEVIESHSNWNYSRSLLFSWAIPYYHFGARFTETKGAFTGGFQLVNGWNNTEDNNKGKTIGLIGNVTKKKFAWMNDYYTGPENTGTNQGWRNLYDTTLLLTPADKFNAYINFDYGQNRAVAAGIGSTAKWYGVAGAAKIGLTDKDSVTPRIEFFKDRDGFSTGTAQTAKEFTFTYEHKLPQGFLTRMEYRHDWSNVAFYNAGTKKHQDTLTIAFVAFFGPK
jgi:hypothetical protein